MDVVVNHLHLREPVPNATLHAARQHISPLLAGDTQQSVGEIVASAGVAFA